MKTLIVTCFAATCGVAAMAQTKSKRCGAMARQGRAGPAVCGARLPRGVGGQAPGHKGRALAAPGPAAAAAEGAERPDPVWREDRGDYVVEKFQFDNGAGSTVPGYVFLPKKAPARLPAILYCHWHAGEYDIGKDELFQASNPGAARACPRKAGLRRPGNRRQRFRRTQRPGPGRPRGEELTGPRRRPPNSTCGSAGRSGECCCATI